MLAVAHLLLDRFILIERIYLGYDLSFGLQIVMMAMMMPRSCLLLLHPSRDWSFAIVRPEVISSATEIVCIML